MDILDEETAALQKPVKKGVSGSAVTTLCGTNLALLQDTRAPPWRLQEVVGGGSPATWHSSRMSAPTAASTRVGGEASRWAGSGGTTSGRRTVQMLVLVQGAKIRR